MFNIYAKSGLPLGTVNELAINTDSAGTISFSVDNPGLVVNGGASYVVPGTLPYIPNFNYANFVPEYGAKGQYASIKPYAVCDTPAFESLGALKLLQDNTYKITLAFRIKPTVFNSTSFIMGVTPGATYSSANFSILTVGAANLSYYFYGVAGGLKNFSSNVNMTLGEWNNIVMVLYYDKTTMSGYTKTYKNGVLGAVATSLTSAQEPGYFASNWFHKFFCSPDAITAQIRDIYISNTSIWDVDDALAYHNETTIDPTKYTLHWLMEKIDDRQCYTELDLVNHMPLYFDTSTNYITWVPKGVAPDPFDTQHVVPITASVAGTYTITATKTDINGVIETFNSVVEVLDPPVNEQYTAQLLIYSDVAATALITMDNPIISFPTSVVVAAGKNQISGLITGDGVCNITVNINGVTDVTTFTIDRIAASLSMGPDIDQGVESFPAALKMHVYSNSDDSIDLVSDNAEIIVSSPVLITNGVAEVDVTINEETTGTITATNDLGMTAVAAVDVYYNPLLLKIGPPQTVLRGDADLTIYLIVVSDTEGMVTLTSSDANLEVPASVVIGDDLFAVIECLAVGGCVATVTATKGIRTGSCVLTVVQSAEANPVPTKGTSHNLPIGEDHDGRNINRISLPNMEDVDWSVFDWLKTMDVSVEGSPELGGFKQVPVIWVGTERSFQSKVYKELRDISGSLNPPYITVSRKGVKKDLNKKGQHWANVPAVYDYLQGVLPIRREIRHDKTAQFMNNNAKRRTGKSSYKFDEVPTDTKPVYEVTYVPIPVYLTFTYEIKIWTSYRSQMNTIEQKLLTYVPAGNINRFVLSHDGHYFEGFLGEDVVEEGNVDAIEKEERKFETTFTLEVLGHVAGEEQNQNSPYAAKRETFAETAVDIELGD